MMDATTLLIGGVIFLIAYFCLRRPDPRFPPSPRRPLPVVGHLVYMSEDYRTQFKEWRKQCGDIFSLNLGPIRVVVLNGYDIIKEALVKKGDVFSDRPPFFIDEMSNIPRKGLLFSDGENWKEQRSVSLSILRDFGMGKNIMAEKIQEEAVHYLDYLASYQGQPVDIRVINHISTANIICSILMGNRFDYNDAYFQDLTQRLGSIASDIGNVSLVNFFFWLRYIPGDFFKAKRATSCVKSILDMFIKIVQEKCRHVENSDDITNLIDAYMIERDRKIKNGISTFQDEKSLIRIMVDLFGAGTDTTSTTIYWCILYMLNHPEVQKKAYLEIKEKIGTDRLPTIQDKTKLTYLNAVILETQRLASIVPLSITHMVSQDVTLRDYTLPKGTQILPNLDSVLHDEVTWGNDAMSFRPERFIDENGKLQVPEQFIPFSIGRRACLGEGMAKMELFLFLASMFQRFLFLPAKPGVVPPLDCEYGLIISPKLYKVRVLERRDLQTNDMESNFYA